MRIRTAERADADSVERLHLAAFPAAEREDIAMLARALLRALSVPGMLNLLADDDGVIKGHVAFSPVTLAGADDFAGAILAPLGVDPAVQGCGLGTGLVEEGLGRLSTQGTNTVFVYGDPAFYGRFGFEASLAEPFDPPYELTYPFGWQALHTNSTVPGPRGGKLSCVAPLSHPGLW